jgi:hypothetical protein
MSGGQMADEDNNRFSCFQWNHVGDGLFMEAMYVEFLSQVMPPSQFFNVVGRL